jgi:hypothetical protein
MMTDRAGAPLERRIRQMLGPAEADFDLVLAESRVCSSEENYWGMLADEGSTPEEALQRRATFGRLGVERYLMATILLQRRQGAGRPVTRRRVLSPKSDWVGFQWLLHWAALAQSWAAGAPLDPVFDCRPRCSPATELRSRSELSDGEWTLLETSVLTEQPFAIEAKIPPSLGNVLTWCDGQTTVRDLFTRAQDSGLLPAGAGEVQFARTLLSLAEHGIVDLGLSPETSSARPVA